MIDTIHLRLDRADIGEFNVEQFGARLSNVKQVALADTGECWQCGTLGNISVSFTEAGVSLKGSLSGYFFPNNSRILTRREVAMALEQMQDQLHLSLAEARVMRLDCSYHWQMNEPIGEYLSRLGALTYFARILATANTLYYNKGGKQLTTALVFYNKNRECAETHKDVAEVYEDTNLLRYECRWLGRVARQLGVNDITASQLHHKDFYRSMVRKWAEFYFAIQKSRDVEFDMSSVTTVKGACDWLLGYFLNRSDAGEVQQVLETMKSRDVFSDPKYYSRLKRHLKDVAQLAQSSNRDVVRELDNNVREVLAYCR